MGYKDNAARILRRLGVVFQSRSLDLDMSVRSNLRFHGNLFGLSGRLLNERIDQAASLFEVVDLLDKQVRTLSGGNQRRIEIVRALINSPALLLMDEPSVGLIQPPENCSASTSGWFGTSITSLSCGPPIWSRKSSRPIGLR